MIKVKVNGQELALKSKSTIQDLLQKLKLKAETTVAELDGKIIGLTEYDTTELEDQASLELIRFVSGG